MIYLNENDLKNIGINWHETISVIEETVKCIANNDFAQPVKPYLKYRNLKNRIIAMPAFVGGDINVAGIKWIASFPDNINKGIKRANSTTIINNADTGETIGIINTSLISVIRTASVSGLVLREFLKHRNSSNITVGIIGFGPIGKAHLAMSKSLLGDSISKILLYDIKNIKPDEIDSEYNGLVEVCSSWHSVYDRADVFITCTVSSSPYIDRKPKNGSIHLNVSLRDYKTDVYDYFKNSIYVDDWEEVCRENTDIENMHKEKGLVKENTKNIVDIVVKDSIKEMNSNDSVIFNPMGMAVFDIAIGKLYINKALVQ